MLRVCESLEYIKAHSGKGKKKKHIVEKYDINLIEIKKDHAVLAGIVK